MSSSFSMLDANVGLCSDQLDCLPCLPGFFSSTQGNSKSAMAVFFRLPV